MEVRQRRELTVYFIDGLPRLKLKALNVAKVEAAVLCQISKLRATCTRGAVRGKVSIATCTPHPQPPSQRQGLDSRDINKTPTMSWNILPTRRRCVLVQVSVGAARCLQIHAMQSSRHCEARQACCDYG